MTVRGGMATGDGAGCPLVSACTLGDALAVRTLLDDPGARLKLLEPFLALALIPLVKAAAAKGHADVIAALAAAGATLAGESESEYDTPLCVAARGGHLAAVRLLLQLHGFSRHELYAALRAAVPHPDVVHALTEEEAPLWRPRRDDDGYRDRRLLNDSPLWLASGCDNDASVASLEHLLDLAIPRQAFDEEEEVGEEEADDEGEEEENRDDLVPLYSMAPLIGRACRTGSVAALQLLLRRGVPLGATEEDRGHAMHHAAVRADAAHLATLLAHPLASVLKLVDAPLYKHDPATPLHWAAHINADPSHPRRVRSDSEWGSLAAVLLLLREGADPNATDLWGQTPLHRACARAWALCERKRPGQPARGLSPSAGDERPALPHDGDDASEDVVAALVRGGADPNRRDGLGNTPAATAIRHDNPAALRALLAAGVDPSHGVSWGKPLCAVERELPCRLVHLATWHSTACLAELLAAGAGANDTEGVVGNTPLHVAAMGVSPMPPWTSVDAIGRSTVAATLLLQHGARTDAINTKGKRPLDMALALLEKRRTLPPRTVTASSADVLAAEELVAVLRRWGAWQRRAPCVVAIAAAFWLS